MIHKQGILDSHLIQRTKNYIKINKLLSLSDM